MVPMIETAEQAQQLVDTVQYALGAKAETITKIIMIESLKAINNLPIIFWHLGSIWVKAYPNIQFLTPAQIEATHGFDTLRVHASHTSITDTVIKQTESRCTTDSRCC